jgi:hypothetical protein
VKPAPARIRSCGENRWLQAPATASSYS